MMIAKKSKTPVQNSKHDMGVVCELFMLALSTTLVGIGGV
jgi:hypothetical protein